MISVLGWRARVSRINSRPWPSGNCRSVSSTRGIARGERGAGLAEGGGGRHIEAGLDQRVLQPPQGRRIVLDQQDRDLLC